MNGMSKPARSTPTLSESASAGETKASRAHQTMGARAARVAARSVSFAAMAWASGGLNW